MEYPPDHLLDSYDGIVTTASASSAHEDLEWINKLAEFIKRVAQEKPQIKFIGLCFGHQIIARACGGQCVRNSKGWEIGPTPIELSPTGKELFGVQSMTIHQMHRDHIIDVPPGFQLLGSTPIANNQGMIKLYTDKQPGSNIWDNIHILTLQGHPEYTEAIVTGLAEIRSKNGTITPEEAADAERRRYWDHDGVGVVGKAICRVLGVAV